MVEGYSHAVSIPSSAVTESQFINRDGETQLTYMIFIYS